MLVAPNQTQKRQAATAYNLNERHAYNSGILGILVCDEVQLQPLSGPNAGSQRRTSRPSEQGLVCKADDRRLTDKNY